MTHLSPQLLSPTARLGAFSSERQLTAATWPRALAAHDVIIATGQSFLNVLLAWPEAMAEVGLLVLDECHHTRWVIRVSDTDCTSVCASGVALHSACCVVPPA